MTGPPPTSSTPLTASRGASSTPGRRSTTGSSTCCGGKLGKGKHGVRQKRSAPDSGGGERRRLSEGQGGARLGDLGGALGVRGPGRRGGLPDRPPLRASGPCSPAGSARRASPSRPCRRTPSPSSPTTTTTIWTTGASATCRRRSPGSSPWGSPACFRDRGRQVTRARLVAERPPRPVDPHLPARPALVQPASAPPATPASGAAGSSTPATRRYYFAGDSGYFHGFAEIGRRFAPIDVAFLPIGAYEPRWFMRAQHVNPEEAVPGVPRSRRADDDPDALGVLRPHRRAGRPRPPGAGEDPRDPPGPGPRTYDGGGGTVGGIGDACTAWERCGRVVNPQFGVASGARMGTTRSSAQQQIPSHARHSAPERSHAKRPPAAGRPVAARAVRSAADPRGGGGAAGAGRSGRPPVPAPPPAQPPDRRPAPLPGAHRQPPHHPERPRRQAGEPGAARAAHPPLLHRGAGGGAAGGRHVRREQAGERPRPRGAGAHPRALLRPSPGRRASASWCCSRWGWPSTCARSSRTSTSATSRGGWRRGSPGGSRRSAPVCRGAGGAPACSSAATPTRTG